MASVGESVRVMALRAGRGLDRRLTELGLNIGTEVMVSHKQSGGGLLLARDGTRLALGSGMAQKVLVMKLEQYQ